jgi:hypothetical protein
MADPAFRPDFHVHNAPHYTGRESARILREALLSLGGTNRRKSPPQLFPHRGRLLVWLSAICRWFHLVKIRLALMADRNTVRIQFSFRLAEETFIHLGTKYHSLGPCDREVIETSGSFRVHFFSMICHVVSKHHNCFVFVSNVHQPNPIERTI